MFQALFDLCFLEKETTHLQVFRYRQIGKHPPPLGEMAIPR